MIWGLGFISACFAKHIRLGSTCEHMGVSGDTPCYIVNSLPLTRHHLATLMAMWSIIFGMLRGPGKRGMARIEFCYKPCVCHRAL